MARIRSVKPSLRTSRVVAAWPFEVRYFWVLLWGYLDDEGRGLDIPKAIAGDCFPLDDAITGTKVDRWLQLMASTVVAGRPAPLCRYEVDGTRYIHAINWDDNQKPNRPRPSLHPPCHLHERSTESFSESSTASGTERARAGGGEVGRRGSGGAARASRTAPAPADGASGAPPPRTCAEHPNGTTAPCRGCQAAREHREAWDADHATTARANATATKAALAAAKTAPPCPHGMPGGTLNHPTTGQPLCPLCRTHRPSELEEPTDAT